MEIHPFNPWWVHTYLFEPCLQGKALVEIAWKGVDFSNLARPVLTLQKRAVFLITGIFLMIPLINTIIWISWQTFGTPVPLFDPYSASDVPFKIKAPVALIRPIEASRHRTVSSQVLQSPFRETENAETFSYNESGKNSIIKTNWKVQKYPHLIVAQQYSDEYSSTSVYQPNWALQEYHYESNEGLLDIRKDGKQLQVKMHPPSKDPIDINLEMTEDIPWIQQATLGFKSFVLSQDEQFCFYGVLNENPFRRFLPFASKPPFLMKMLAQKKGMEALPGFGNLIKVEVQSEWGWPYNLITGELWFDPQTGILRKYIDPGFLQSKTGEWATTP